MKLFNTPLEAFLHWEKNTPNKIFLKQPFNKTLHIYTYKEAGQEIRKIAGAIQAHNLPNHSHIALLSKNCAHWILADLAILMTHNVSIPVYPSLNSTAINQILVHSESKLIILGKLDTYEEQKQGIPDIPKISVNLFGVNEGESWENIVLSTAPTTDITPSKPDDLHTIIYTSGTTGIPKGVMHTVGNFMNSINIVGPLLSLKDHSRFFSYLPLSHIAERVISAFALTIGGEISFTESLETFAADLEATQPHTFFAVPRIWTKFQEKILEALPQKKLNLFLTIPILNTIVKNKLKKKIGLKESVITISGAAPLAKEVMEWYQKIGIEILQVYGMTEDCCISHFSLPNQNKIGAVGKALPGVQIKLLSDGEILIKNPCLMKGYFRNPEITSEVLTAEGYFRTGDIGEYDHHGYLTITGRVKDQFKTDKGKYISPSPIELKLAENNNVEQLCVVGTGIPQPIVLIVLSQKGKQKDPKVLELELFDTIKIVNSSLERYEYIQKVIVMKEDWTLDNGLMTPTLKVKRNQVEKIHREYYKSWFECDDKLIFE
jgi:long-chain acyl-CoA synthetase